MGKKKEIKETSLASPKQIQRKRIENLKWFHDTSNTPPGTALTVISLLAAIVTSDDAANFILSDGLAQVKLVRDEEYCEGLEDKDEDILSMDKVLSYETAYDFRQLEYHHNTKMLYVSIQ